MITASKFFNKLRIVLAAGSSKDAVTEAVTDGIENEILPQLRAILEDTNDEGKREELLDQIELWEKYADPGSSEGRSWGEDAQKVVGAQVQKFGFESDKVDDVLGYVAGALYEHDKMDKMFDRFDIDSGPQGLLKLFKKIVSEEAIDELRRLQLERERGVSAETPVGEEEDTQIRDMLEDDREDELERRELEQLKENMADWMRKETSGELETLFDIWWDIAEKKDPDRIKWKSDILPEWQKETGKGATMMDRTKKKMYKKMVEYFEDVLDVDVDQQTLESLKLADVADKFWKRKFASWMLAPLYAKMRMRRETNAVL